jgi:hypothetical protein
MLLWRRPCSRHRVLWLTWIRPIMGSAKPVETMDAVPEPRRIAIRIRSARKQGLSGVDIPALFTLLLEHAVVSGRPGSHGSRQSWRVFVNPFAWRVRKVEVATSTWVALKTIR